MGQQSPLLISDIDRFVRFQNECAEVFVETLTFVHAREPKLAAICGDQFNFLAGRSNAIVELIKGGTLWDAQILARPLIESCVKICFLCFAPEASRPNLCYEYEELLGIVNALKLHDKAVISLRAAGGGDHPVLRELVLPEDRLTELRAKVPKVKRRELENRWGFTSMMVQLDKQFNDRFGGTTFGAFAHPYGLSSHLIHADETGLGTIRARDRLREPALSRIERSHYIVLLDAIAGCAMLSAIALAWAAQLNLDKVHVLLETHSRLLNEAR